MHFKISIIFSILAIVLMFTGCATTKTDTASPAISVPQAQPEIQEQTVSEPPKGIQMSFTQPFANRVEWPKMPENADNSASFNITSGTGDDVWVEGKGYFHGTLDDVYQDLTNEQIIGPTHMTRDIERAEFTQTELKTSYVMHIKMKYVLPIKFDLTATLEPIFENGELAGYLYHSEKTAGTTFIKVISDTLLVKKLDNNMFSAEFLSVNKATQDREEEARGHAETLFSYWDEAGKNRYSQSNAALCEPQTVEPPAEIPPAQAESGIESTESQPVQTEVIQTETN